MALPSAALYKQQDLDKLVTSMPYKFTLSAQQSGCHLLVITVKQILRHPCFDVVVFSLTDYIRTHGHRERQVALVLHLCFHFEIGRNSPEDIAVLTTKRNFTRHSVITTYLEPLAAQCCPPATAHMHCRDMDLRQLTCIPVLHERSCKLSWCIDQLQVYSGRSIVIMQLTSSTLVVTLTSQQLCSRALTAGKGPTQACCLRFPFTSVPHIRGLPFFQA